MPGFGSFPSLPGLAELIESDTPYGAGTVDAVRSYARPLKQDSVRS